MRLPVVARQLPAAVLLLVSQLALCTQWDVHAHTTGPRARFLYAATSDLNAIVEFRIGVDGALAGPDYFSLPSGSGPQMVVADPAGKFLFAIESQGILAFTIDSQTGGLTEVPGSPFPVGAYGDYPTAIGIDPGGNFVYVTIADPASPTLSAYRIDRNAGTLTAVTVAAGLYFGSQPKPTSIQTDPTGKFVYLVDPVSGAIAGYPVNLANGDLGRAISPTPFAAGLAATVISTSADFLYVFARNQVADLVGYSFDHSSGALRPVPGTFFTSHPGWANYITIDPVHNILYQASFDNNSIGVYRLLGDGSLRFQTLTAVGEVMAAETLLVDSSGTLLFAVGASASFEGAPPLVSSFRIDPITGDLVLAGQSQPFNSLNYYSSLAAAP
jgi:6-phosphogluconolactonase (cycloisomerase 2 family)